MKSLPGALRAGCILACAAALVAVGSLRAADPAAGANVAKPTVDNKLQWWSDARFGMFIHWGLYASNGNVLTDNKGVTREAGGEHAMQHLLIPNAQYEKLADDFNPTKFNADQWVAIAKGAGMKYMVITTKHHDGFAMYDSPSDPYNIVKRTPFKRDPIKELSDACQKAGIKFGTYYSLGRDWRDPDCVTPSGARSNTWDFPDEKAKVYSKYFDRKALPQVTELVTQYKVALMWFDTPEATSVAESKQLVETIHRISPSTIINSRVGHNQGDYEVQEQKIPAGGDPKPWETCMTMNGHWGWVKSDNKWKPTQTLVRNLIDIASKGGNYLLNVGPTEEGLIPDEAVSHLNEIGAWMKVNGEAIYGTGASPLGKAPAWGRITKRVTGDSVTLYLHVFEWPADGKLTVPGLKDEVTSAMLLANGTKLELPAGVAGNGVTLSVPTEAPDKISSTIVLKVKGPLGAE